MFFCGMLHEAGDKRGLSLTGGTPPHEADELLRPGLPRHPPEDLPERVRGEPSVLHADRAEEHRNTLTSRSYTSVNQPSGAGDASL